MRRYLILLGLSLVASLGTPIVKHAAAANLPPHWIGIYYYKSGTQRRPVTFEMRVISNNGNTFTARMREAATFGRRPCRQLTANIEGSFTDRIISFKKTYDGSCGVSHSVQYVGRLSDNLQKMNGTWHIGPTSGQFTADAK